MLGIEPPPSKRPENYEVMPDAWPAVWMFLKVQTQWRADSGAVIGLDYGAVRWLMELYGIDDQRQVLADLQIIEATVVAGIAKRRK